MKRNILIFGEVLVDSIDNVWYSGGAPFNVACHLKGFRLNPILISKVGRDDIGDFLLNKIKSIGLDRIYINIDRYPSGLVDVTIKDNEPTFYIVEDRAYDYIEIQKIKNIQNYSMLYYGSLACRYDVSYRSLLKIKESFRGVTFVDINIRQPWFNKKRFIPLLKYVDWLKVNIKELDILVTGEKSLEEKILELTQLYSIKNIICTRGSDGAIIYSSEDNIFYTQRGINIDRFINSIGAGDAFTSSVIRSIIADYDKKTMLKDATNFASKVCSLKSALPESLDFYD